MARKFFDNETREIITEKQLFAEFTALQKDDPETYDYSFSDYIRNCTDKNGTLTEIK